MSDKTYGQRLVLIENARSFGAMFRVHLGFLLISAGIVVVAFLLPWVALRWLVVGLSIGISSTMLMVLISRPTDPAVRGQWAEQWSIERLRKVKGWLVTDNLPFDGYDVDHVAVTPSTVLAVETKFRNKVSNPQFDDQRHQRELRAAQEAARKLSLFLRSKKLNQSCAVTPVLMVWGPGRPILPDGYRRDGDVYVVEAYHPELWSHLFAAPTLSPDARRIVHAAVQGYATTRAGHEAKKHEPLRRAMWSAFRQGLSDTKSERASRRELHRSVKRRHAARADGVPASPAPVLSET